MMGKMYINKKYKQAGLLTMTSMSLKSQTHIFFSSVNTDNIWPELLWDIEIHQETLKSYPLFLYQHC